MNNDLRALEDWAGGLLARLEPRARRQLSQQIARDLRKSQQQRITAQRNPDGSAYAPRKPRLRDKTGRIKRKMFTRLKTAKHLKVQTDANSLGIAFLGRTARLARVHQYGLRDRPARNAPQIAYPSRQLLGFSDQDLQLIRDRLISHLTAEL